MLVFRKFTRHTKPAVIPCCDIFFSALNQQSSRSIRNFFILCLISSQPRAMFFFLRFDQQSSQNEGRTFFGKYKTFFQGGIFLFFGLGVRNWPRWPYIYYFRNKVLSWKDHRKSSNFPNSADTFSRDGGVSQRGV